MIQTGKFETAISYLPKEKKYIYEDFSDGIQILLKHLKKSQLEVKKVQSESGTESSGFSIELI